MPAVHGVNQNGIFYPIRAVVVDQRDLLITKDQTSPPPIFAAA